ncbi:MAG: DUF1800 domain-containing protein [Planctomycetaceae bacterium]|nr:DUF1800 domain-containing protein [Planctomycetaceae bacterium]
MFTPYSPTAARPWDLRRVVHLHKRAGFAADWNMIQRDLRDGPDVAMERLLAPQTGETGGTPFEELSRVICDAAVESGSINRLKAWWLYRMLLGPDPLGERLTLMWHNHFATSFTKVEDVGLMRRQNDTFRRHARGAFGELLAASLHEPALLVWLDAEANRQEHPNENLAREMMELFSLGVGNYSETDIREAARALTGWTVNRGAFRLQDAMHDAGEKTIFGQTGAWTGDDAVRLLAEHPAVSGRIAFRICELLLGEGVATESMLAMLAAGLHEHDLSIGWAVATVLRSEEFFADANIGTRVTGPVEFVIGAARALELTAPPPSTLRLAEVTARLGQDLFAPPNVFGWTGGRAWLTSRNLISRANFTHDLIEGKLHPRWTAFDAAAFAAAHGFTTAPERAAFFAQLLLGRSDLPAPLLHLVDDLNRLVAAILASPEAQLA